LHGYDDTQWISEHPVLLAIWLVEGQQEKVYSFGQTDPTAGGWRWSDDEIYGVAIGPPGVYVIEIKHWESCRGGTHFSPAGR